MEGLFDSSVDFDADFFRNIVSLRKSEDLFDDITGGEADLGDLAVRAEMRVKETIPAGIIDRGFHYSTAIDYPFRAGSYVSSRYSDGTFPVLYGSLDMETTIHETAYHMARFEADSGQAREKVARHRAIYLIHGRAVLVDLSRKRERFAGLTAGDYGLTQQVGRRLSSEGHPGLLAPSARCSGINTVFFRREVLSDPRVYCYLTYRYDPADMEVAVERAPGELVMTVNAARWFR